MRWLTWAMIAGTVLLLTGPAQSANQKDRDECADRANREVAIAGCTRIIRSQNETARDRAEAYFKRGNVFRAKGDNDLALADFNEAIRLNPKYSQAYNNRGLVWRAKGDRDRAIADFTEAIRLQPNAISYANRADDLRVKGETDRAIVDFNEAIRLNPKYGLAFHNRAITWRAKGDNDRALADYNEAIRLDSNAVSYLGRGLVWRAKSDNDRAIADFDEAIRLNPKYTAAYYDRGEAFRAKGDNDRAMPDYNEAIRLDPKYAFAYHARGIIWRAKGDNDRAISDYDEAIRLRPHPIPYNSRGNAWRAKGDNDRALADYSEAIRLDPKYTFAYFNRGEVYRAKNDNDRAIADYSEAIRLDPKYVIAYNNRGNAWRAKGDNDRAIADYGEAIRLNPKYVIGYNNRGHALRAKGDNDRAIADFDEAIRLDPKYARAYSGRGLVYLQLGRLDQAIAAYNEALKLDPKLAGSLYGRGLAKQRRGDTADANADIVAAKAIKSDIAEEFQRVGVFASIDATPDTQSTTAHTTYPDLTTTTLPAAHPQLAPSPTGPVRRVALVIGNSTYKAVERLANPSRDATAVAAALRGIGFATVTVELDVSRDQFIKALRAFELEAEKSDWAVIYYAGHGMELGGVNYLIPVDAGPKTVRDVQDEAVPLERVLASVENARQFRLVILDACRDNPLVAQLRPSGGTRSIGRGLSRIEPERGVLVAYSARHGQLALDGDGTNSPFAAALIKRLTVPNLEIGKLFRLVRDDVLAATGKRQEPFTYGSLPGEDLYFVQK